MPATVDAVGQGTGNIRCMAEPLSDDELATFFRLLRRYAEAELDQWENWRCATEYGDVFISMARRPPAGYEPSHFEPLPIQPP